MSHPKMGRAAPMADFDTTEARGDWHNLRSEMTADAGDGDPWGWCMAWWFAIAGTLHDRGDSVPAEWQYRTSPLGGVDPDDWHASAIRDLEIGAPALVHAGNVLMRYAARCRRAGLDY
jgi:hypothetical protein